ncbi:hypothetical protein LDENG_00123950 [Lucifuga dentata]|nr:hypothetical protein LDENG_00123950 [Lucifuga dentata]
MNRMMLAALAVLLCSSGWVSGGKILVFPLDGSHWINMKVLIEELHSRGHEVMVMRPFDSWYIKADSPHYETMNINSSIGFSKELFGSFATRMMNIQREGASIWVRLSLEYELMAQFYEINKQVVQMLGEIFENTKMMQSLQDAKYDVVLTDPVIGAGVLLAHRLDLPLVLNVRWTVQGEGHLTIAI